MQKYDNPEFWGRVIKEAKKQAAPLVVRHAYRPVGYIIVMSFLVLAQLLQMGMHITAAILLTMLIMLVAFVLS